MADKDKAPGADAPLTAETYDPAVEWFRRRTVTPASQIKSMEEGALKKAFYVTGVSDLEALKAVKASLERALAKGETFEDWKADVKAQGLFKSPEFTRHRLETIFRTNIQNAFSGGRYSELTSPAVLRRRPYWRFSAVRDNRTTSVCAAAHGTILPTDHPWWKTHIPPLHFNCRSTIVPMTEAKARERGITQNPTQLTAALGFGGPPDAVPVDPSKKPTAEDMAEARKAQEAIEKANAAAAEATKAKHELTQAKRDAEAAVKEAQKASPDEAPTKQEAQKQAHAEQEAAEAALEKASAKKEIETARARKASEGRQLPYEPTQEEMKRRFGKDGEDFSEMMNALKTAKPTRKNGRPAFELTTPNGVSIIIQEGDSIREKLAEYKEAKYRGPKEQPGKTSLKTKKKLDEEKWGHLPKHIRDDVERIANEEGGPDLLPEPESLEEALKKINPNYSKTSSEYGYNCPQCAAALTARLRGLDVEACPKTANPEKDIYKYPGTLLAYHTEGQPIGEIKGGTNNDKKAVLEREMAKAPEGALFAVQVYGKQGGSHIFNAKKENGEIRFIDSQPNIEDEKENIQSDCSVYFDGIAEDKPIRFMRVDNLKFSDYAPKVFFRSTKQRGKK